ncbi:hypothetical protein [Microcoleus sp. CAWBG640]|uniref:hypothetical protein n=1 Tax=Microcoleus sp. CAWBG640 TaxID=2841653 RepID=UPI00312BB4B8
MRYKKMRDRFLVSRIASTLKAMSVGRPMPLNWAKLTLNRSQNLPINLTRANT